CEKRFAPMQKSIVLLFLCAHLAASSQTKPTTPITAAKSDSIKFKKPALSFDEKVRNSRRSNGLFTLFQDTLSGGVQLYVRKAQFSEEFIYQSFSLSGPTALFLNQSMHRSNFIFKVQKAFDRLEFSRVNTSFYYDPQNPISKTKDVDKPEAVFFSEKIIGEDSAGYLINADGLFLSEKLDPVRPAAQSGYASQQAVTLGNLNPTKTKYAAVQAFPKNTDVVVDLAYDNPAAAPSGGADITDARYVRVRIQHSFIAVPKNDFKPRSDDPRIGYFGQQVTDQTSISPTPYKDIINRWNLVKKNGADSLSEPIEPIVFWIENTTPYEYRRTIAEAGLKWNAAFEKAGFKNAIQMKIMPDTATWDPSDIRYNVIRWVSSANPSYGAIGPSFVNPRTGQILGADITIEWYSGSASPIFDDLSASRKPLPATPETGGMPENYTMCTIASDLKSGLLTGMTTLETTGAGANEISEMHKQFLTYLIMHEMGHTLGLNHNMKSSQMWSRKEINNKELTRKWGLIGSVMDYPAINIALDPKQQGDYYTTLAGPYDLWAIQYGYTPFVQNEYEGLKNIAARSTDPRLAFGNDGDDMRTPGKAMDPRINVNDLTSDAIGYAEERFQLVNNLLSGLLKKYTKDGQSFAELRSRYAVLQSQRFNSVATISRYIGGVYVDRSFPEQHSGTAPFTPVPLATQKRALSILAKYVFAPDAFAPDSSLFPYLQPQRRLFNQSFVGDDYKISATALGMQYNGALAHLLHPATLQRLTNSRMYGNGYSVADLLGDLNKSIFAADLKGAVNVYRQYLQTAYTESLLQLLDERSNYDAVSKAAALRAIQKLKADLATAVSPNEETKAHRAHLFYVITKALKAD
ncbi:MAG TPA: zinc-dependent metalloprotease, partial [Chitinophagaceae bacterium]|nr:zinc-dependent metalloprotease [Chitinophagaceae bacterium]